MAIKKRKLYLGPRIRRLRRERGLTQAQMAGDLGVSPSYVNLVERNQRPVSADLLVRLAQTFDLDLSAFSEDRADDVFASLNEAFADPLFQNAGVTREDAHELAAGNLVLGEAVAALYRAYQTARSELLEARAAGRGGPADPVEEARTFLHAARNYFAPLEEVGEKIAGEADFPAGGLFAALARRFETKHRLRVRVLPADVMAGAYRRLNRHSGEVLISESLDQASRVFHLALQLALVEQSTTLDRLVNEAKFESDAGRRLARAALANYAAAAIMLPYDAFLKAAKEFGYDVEALGRRFSASFEQVAHRLTTLQRPGAEGVPFFFLRVDAAGNVSKRYSADVFPFARYGGSCPLWNLHDAFRTPRRVLTQIVQLPDGSRYFSIARTVQSGAGGFRAQHAERAVALGCAIEHAGELVYAKDMDIETAEATPIGVTCRLCERPDCAARAHPPLRRRLIVDEHRRLATPFSFSFD
jgi:predicted transcriptional regulator/transcriptional regulator with XRE-family HTH domain